MTGICKFLVTLLYQPEHLKMVKFHSCFFILMILVLQANAQSIYLTHKGNVTFVSDAPLEFITAQSNELSGAIDLDNNHFAFICF